MGFSTKIKDLMDPGFYFVDDERTQEATVVDVLAHRMGVPDHTYLRLNQVLTRANLVEYIYHILLVAVSHSSRTN